jgi:hypothetical protein
MTTQLRETSGPTRSGASVKGLRRIERTEQRLWLLALVLFLLFAVSVFLWDASLTREEQTGRTVTRQLLGRARDYSTSIGLAAVILLICAYFYEKLKHVRSQNRGLVHALESSRRTLAQRNRQLDTWTQLSHSLITQFNLPRLLDLIVRTAAEVTGSDCAAVMLSEQSNSHLRLAAVHQRGLQTELARRVAATVIKRGQRLCFSRESVPEEFARPDLPWEDLETLAAAPLSTAGNIVGALLVGRVRDSETFTEDIVEPLESFASQASIALEKAHLYAENQKQLDRLAELVDGLEAAGASSVEAAGLSGQEG